MNTKIYDLCVATRKFQENGQDKNHYENIGAMFENDEHKRFIMLKAYFNPAAISRKDNSESILVSCFTPQNKQDNFLLNRPTSTTKIYDLAVITGQYQDNTGQTKNRYYNVGAVLANDKSTFIMLKAHFNPSGVSRKESSESILVSCFPPKAKEERNGYEPQNDFAPVEENSFGSSRNGSDIPF